MAAAPLQYVAPEPELSSLLEEGTTRAPQVLRQAGAWKRALASVVVVAASVALFSNVYRGVQQPTHVHAGPPKFRAAPHGLTLLSEEPATSVYTVMIDCGSSGSRLTVYNVSAGKLETVNDGDDDEIKSFALSDYFEKPKEAGPMIGKMVQDSLDFVPPDMRASTPLYVFATAGLRLLEGKEVQAVWAAVRLYLMIPKHNPYQFSPRHAKTMPGNMEGVYQYLTIQNLLHNKTIDPVSPPAVKRLGLLEMGGASLQVAFRPRGPILLDDFQLYMNDNMTDLFSTSYLGFGSDQARLRAQKVLARRSGKKSTVEDPCLFKGDNETSEIHGRNVTFVGSSEPTACQNLVKGLLHTHYECVQKPCGILGQYQPLPAGKFLGIESFFYTATHLGLVGWKESKPVPPKDFLASALAVCKLSKDELATTPPYDDAVKNNDWSLVKGLCFDSWLCTELLDAYGFAPDDLSVNYTRKLNNEDITWTRGAVLYQTLYMPPTLTVS